MASYLYVYKSCESDSERTSGLLISLGHVLKQDAAK